MQAFARFRGHCEEDKRRVSLYAVEGKEGGSSTNQKVLFEGCPRPAKHDMTVAHVAVHQPALLDLSGVLTTMSLRFTWLNDAV